MAGDLLEGRVAERVELKLHHRPHAVHGHANGGADDARLGQRRVEHARLAELLGQAIGHPEHTAERADVLTKDIDGRVVLKSLAQGPVERGRERDRGHHADASSARRWSRWARSCAVGSV
jgi:hypothetical protein